MYRFQNKNINKSFVLVFKMTKCYRQIWRLKNFPMKNGSSFCSNHHSFLLMKIICKLKFHMMARVCTPIPPTTPKFFNILNQYQSQNDWHHNRGDDSKKDTSGFREMIVKKTQVVSVFCRLKIFMHIIHEPVSRW